VLDVVCGAQTQTDLTFQAGFNLHLDPAVDVAKRLDCALAKLLARDRLDGLWYKLGMDEITADNCRLQAKSKSAATSGQLTEFMQRCMQEGRCNQKLFEEKLTAT